MLLDKYTPDLTFSYLGLGKLNALAQPAISSEPLTSHDTNNAILIIQKLRRYR